MLSNKQLKFLKSLHQRKFRQKYGIFLAEGVKTGNEIINSPSVSIDSIYAVGEWLDKNQAYIANLSSNIVHQITEKELKAISMLKTPNQVLFLLKIEAGTFSIEDIKNSYSLYLDEIKDPGNLGTILRIADWFGIDWVFMSEGCVEVQNPKVIQSSMGAFLRIKTAKLDLPDLLSQAKNLAVIGTKLDGESVFEAKMPGAALVVIGNESKGISPAVGKLLTHAISIPRHPSGGAESLNAAVATGIICSVLRNR